MRQLALSQQRPRGLQDPFRHSDVSARRGRHAPAAEVRVSILLHPAATVIVLDLRCRLPTSRTATENIHGINTKPQAGIQRHQFFIWHQHETLRPIVFKRLMQSSIHSVGSINSTHIDLMVSPRDVQAVQGISELIESTQMYISRTNPTNGAQNVAIIFAAVLNALRTSDIKTKRSDDLAQYFSYMYRSDGYRVSMSFQYLSEARNNRLTHEICNDQDNSI